LIEECIIVDDATSYAEAMAQLSGSRTVDILDRVLTRQQIVTNIKLFYDRFRPLSTHQIELTLASGRAYVFEGDVAEDRTQRLRKWLLAEAPVDHNEERFARADAAVMLIRDVLNMILDDDHFITFVPDNIRITDGSIKGGNLLLVKQIGDTYYPILLLDVTMQSQDHSKKEHSINTILGVPVIVLSLHDFEFILPEGAYTMVEYLEDVIRLYVATGQYDTENPMKVFPPADREYFRGTLINLIGSGISSLRSTYPFKQYENLHEYLDEISCILS